MKRILKTKGLIGIIYLFLALHSAPLHAGLSKCLSDELSLDIRFTKTVFSNITEDTSLESLSNIYSQLREVTDRKLIKNLEAKRLINQKDWKKVSDQKKAEPWLAYGDKTIKDWFNAREYILSLPKDRKIDSVLLKKIHKITTKNHKFHGFEGRRLLKKKNSGEISQEEFSTLLKRAYKDNEELAGVSHSSLRGVFRKDAIDQIEHKGSSFKSDKSRYFTKTELEELRKNKYITVVESSLKKTGDAYTGKALYLDVSQVEKAVKEILKSSNQKLKQAKTKRDIIETVVLMEKNLISVHPFLDGNGRSIRLLGDYVLRKYNLPPSLYPNESDLTMPLKEAVDFRIKGMKDYLKEHQKELIKIQNNRKQIAS